MKALKLSLTLFLLCSTVAFSNEKENDFNAYLSDYKKKQFDYDYVKNKAESSKLRDSWIAPLQLNYTYSRSNPEGQELTSKTAAIRMDQPIFQSGGIYYGVRFAQASEKYGDFSTDVAKRKMIKETVSILMQIKLTQLKEKKQELQIKNSEINLLQKEEQYLNGQLDSGFLDNAIIQRNVVIQTLYDIQTSKEKLITQFHTLSDLDYKQANIPHLELLSEEEFLQHNIVLKMNQSEIEKNRYKKNVTITKYLPSINFVAGYNWNDTEQYFGQGTILSNNVDYYDYGVRARINLDINTFKDIESAKVDYLKSQVLQKDKQRELAALFEQVIHNIDNYEKKVQLSAQNADIYSKLLKDTKDLYAAGYKTEYDVQTLENSLEIQKIDSKIYAIDKQLELLNLYEMYVNEGK
jgi:outer membrane protein TolC